MTTTPLPVPPPPIQTLAHGTPTVSKGTAFLGGVSGVAIIPPLETLLGCIVGYSGTGKSSLLQSNPNCFIINTEVAGTSNPNPHAMIWPVRDYQGNPAQAVAAGTPDPKLGVPLQKMTLTWELVREKVKAICDARLKGEAGPITCIGLDSVAGAMKLLADWALRNSVRLGISQEPKDNFNLLHGPSAYDAMYTELLEIGLEARNQGVGFWYVVHLADKMVKRQGMAEAQKEMGFIITDNLWLRLMPYFEMIGAIAIETRTEIISTPGKMMPGGKQGPPTNTTVSKQVRVAQFTAQDLSMQQVLKKRGVKMPDKIDLPESEAWAKIASIYEQSASNPL